MRHLAFAGALALAFTACASPDYGRPLPPGKPALIALKPGEHRPDFGEGFEHRAEILPALERSLAWFEKPSSQLHFPVEGVSHERARLSLVRFKELLEQSASTDDFVRGLELDFTVYKSAGWNAKGGGVLYTAYCTPIFEGSRTRSATYAYPLYAMPPDLVKAKRGDMIPLEQPDGREALVKAEGGEILGRRTASGGLEPYPSRREIEASALLESKALELAWLKDPLDVFIAQVQGSVIVETQAGEMLRFGYAAKNGREYSSLGKELIKAKEIKAKDMSLSKIREWGRAHPEKLREYMARNDSYVFFQEIDSNPSGSLGFPVEAERTLATDKALFPRGGLVFVETPKPQQGWRWPWQSDPSANQTKVSKFMLDQDAGGAIRTAGRADMYLGIGPDAELRAGKVMAEGQMYYLFLKSEEVALAAP